MKLFLLLTLLLLSSFAFAGDYKIMATDLATSSLTNTPDTGDNLEVLTGNLTIDTSLTLANITAWNKINVSGSLNVNSNSVVTFNDTLGCGFGSSNGTINMNGASNAYINLTMSNGNESTNYADVNASSLTSYDWRYVNVINWEALAEEKMHPLGTNVSAKGEYWIFTGPILSAITLDGNDLTLNTTTIVYGNNATLNFTANHDTGLYSMGASIYCIGGNQSEDLIINGTNTSQIWVVILGTELWNVGQCDVGVNASSTHNPPTTEIAMKHADNTGIKVGDKVFKSKTPKKFDIAQGNKIEIMLDDTTIGYYTFLNSDDSDVNTTVMRTDQSNYDTDHCAKTNNKGEIEVEVTGGVPIKSKYYAGLFIFAGSNYLDFQEEFRAGAKVEVEGNIITLTRPDWKSNSIVCIRQPEKIQEGVKGVG